jgi:hypothetical protein
MQIMPKKLRPALHEVHRTAHDQDLIEVPRRARLDREVEQKRAGQGIPLTSHASIYTSHH